MGIAVALSKKIGKKTEFLLLKFLQARYPKAEIEVWSMDEHRLGLHPILRRVWIPEGSIPTPLSYKSINGCGCMVLYTQNQVKPIGGFCPM